jgi:hypothetical protein
MVLITFFLLKGLVVCNFIMSSKPVRSARAIVRDRIKSGLKRKAPRLVRKGRFPNRFAFRSKLTVLDRPKNQRNWGAPKILRFVRFA